MVRETQPKNMGVKKIVSDIKKIDKSLNMMYKRKRVDSDVDGDVDGDVESKCKELVRRRGECGEELMARGSMIRKLERNNRCNRIVMWREVFRCMSKVDRGVMWELFIRFKRGRSYGCRIKCLEEMKVEESKSGDNISNKEEEECCESDMKGGISEDVWRWYRNKLGDNTILLHESFELERMVYGGVGVGSKRWLSLLLASTQAGKTFPVIALMHIMLSMGYSPVLVLKDVYQKEQFMSRYREYGCELVRMLRSLKKYGEGEMERYVECLYSDSTNSRVEVEGVDNNIKLSMEGSRVRTVVCLWNALHVKRICRRVVEGVSKMVLFVDEAHKLGGYKRVSSEVKYQDTYSTGNEGVKYDSEYLKLKKLAVKVVLVTATPQNIIVAEPELYCDGIVVMPEGRGYRGIENCKFSIIADKKSDVGVNIGIIDSRGVRGSVSVPNSFLEEMSKLSEKGMIERVNKFGFRDKHPVNVLAKFEITNKGQRDIMGIFKGSGEVEDDRHRKIVGGDWTVMVMNQEGIRMYSKNLVGVEVEIGGHKYVSDREGEFLFSKRVSVGDVWHWMWKNDISRFGRIVTVGYKSAEEGLTFSSSWGETVETDGNIHLTHLYSRCGEGISSSNLEQLIGRLNGNHGDVMESPVIMCPLGEKEKVLKSITLHRRMISDINDMKFRNKDSRVIDSIHGYEVFENLVPKKYYGEVRGVKKAIKKIYNPNSEMEEFAFKVHSSAKDILCIINPNMDGGDKRELEKQYYEIMNDMNSKDRVEEWEKLRVCYNRGGKVRKIIEAYKTNGYRGMSSVELSRVCGGKFQYDNYNHWHMGRHAKYYIISKGSGDMWNIRKEVMEKLNEWGVGGGGK